MNEINTNKLIDYRQKKIKNGCVQFGFPILEGYRKTACECSNNIIYENIYKDPYSKCIDPGLRYTQTIKKVQNKNGWRDTKYSNSYGKYLHKRAKGFESARIKETACRYDKCYNGSCANSKCTNSKCTNSECTNSECTKLSFDERCQINRNLTNCAGSNGEKLNRLKHDTVLRGQYGKGGNNIDNSINGSYPISLYKNTHPINKKKSPDPCEIQSCYNQKSCIKFCK